jgi:hypothetical protein
VGPKLHLEPTKASVSTENPLNGTTKGIFVIRLDAEPLATCRGGVVGLAPTSRWKLVLMIEDSIDNMAAAGIPRGCNPPINDNYCPDDLLTRGQTAAFFRRALG